MSSIPWLSWNNLKVPPPPEEIKGLVSRLKVKAETIPAPLLALSAFAVGSITAAAGNRVYTRYFRRFRNGDWITPNVFAKKRWIKGVVTK